MRSLKLSALLIGFAMLVMSASRLLLYVLYSHDFAELGASQVAIAFLEGLRFDLSILLLTCSLPLLMMHLPAAFARRVGWVRGWSWVAFASFAVLLLVIGGDLVYFGIVRRHLSTELWLLQADLTFLLDAPLIYVPATLSYLAALGIVGLVWRRIVHSYPPTATQPGRSRALEFVLALLVLFLGIRGSLQSKSMTVADAFTSESFAQGSLALNGAYSAYRSRSREAPVDVSISLDEALAELELSADQYPLSKQTQHGRPTGKNAVVILLESWDTRYVGAYGQSERDLTPRFDELAREGLLFTNLFSSSQRSIGALQAELIGITPMPGIPEIGFGLELSNISRVGAMAHAEGYETLLVQAPNRRSYYMDSVSELMGFEHYFGQEDIPEKLDEAGVHPKFGWDHETLQFAMDRIEEYEQPFLAVVITGTTHSPYADPGEPFHRVPHTLQGENGFINTLAYSDWALGEFMDRARAEDWYSNTVFVIGADHPFRANAPDDLTASFRIPFVLLGAGASGVDAHIRSQVDVMPTLVELLGLQGSFASLGSGLLDDPPGWAIVNRGAVLGIITPELQLQHSLNHRLDVHCSPASCDEEFIRASERKLLATYRVTSDLLQQNRWQAPTTPDF